MLAGTASFVLVALVLGVGLRSGRLVAAILFTLAAGLVLTGAFGLLAFGSFNVISVAFAVLFIGLGIDFAIHFGLRFQEERSNGHAPIAAVGRTAATVGVALALCALTTALAFVAFTPTAYVGLGQLGAIAAFGMVISLLLTLTLLPALLVLFRVPQRTIPASTDRSWLRPGIRRALVALALLLSAASATQLPDVRFDADPLRLKDPEAPSVVTFRELEETSSTSLHRISVVAADTSTAAALAERLAAVSEVGDVLWVERFVPEDQETKLALLDDARLFLFVPESAPVVPSEPGTLAAALQRFAAETKHPAAAPLVAAIERAGSAGSSAPLAVEAAVFAYWPKLLEDLATAFAAAGVTRADLPASLTARYVAADGRLYVEVTPADRLDGPTEMRRFVDAVAAVAPDATGGTIQAVRGGEVVRAAMLQATGLATVAIVGLLWLTLRGVRPVLLVLLPVGVATLLTLGAAVVFGLDFNFANVIVLPLLIGFGVDSAIHVVLRAQEETAHDPLHGTTTARAVVLSALTTVGSFGTLALSPHAGTASMGQLLTVSVLATMMASLLVLPAAVRLLGAR